MIRLRTGLASNLAALLIGCALALGVGELVVRLQRGRLFAVSRPRHDMLRLLHSAYPAKHDARLGYVPQPGFEGRDNVWGTQVTIDSDGLRVNGAPAPGGKALLAVGDSFTFGDEVGDADTWPARLERRLQQSVLNGGVFGYGLDQSVLGAESLLERQRASGLILALIPTDVDRCEYSYRFAAKPYFDVASGALVLRNVPVPPPAERQEPPAWLAYSHLVDFAMLRVAREGWLAGATDLKIAHQRGEEVARLLLERILSFARAREVPVLLLLQGEASEEPRRVAGLLRHAQLLGVPVLDLIGAASAQQRTLGRDVCCSPIPAAT